ncbi:hypothetical protein LIER_22125 [Lithospermum erythrorhizon]|uniref:Polyprotein n=1 Tax=Lithospermum erythrorhizon TaxID=34254 RepID=A0AAV3QW59_LITER
MIDRKFNAKVRVVRSDNGIEFFCLHDYFLKHDIVFQTSYVGTNQQNGRVEHKHRHILNASSSVVTDYVEHSGSDLVAQGEGVDVTEELGRGKHDKVPFVRLKHYVTNTVQKSSSSSVASSSSHSSATHYPISHFVNYNRFSIRHINFLSAVTATAEPKSVKEAMEDPKWREAM